MFESNQASKSAVKLIKNSKGVNWEIKVIAGEEHLMEGLRKTALASHRVLEHCLDEPDIQETPIAEQNPLLSDNDLTGELQGELQENFSN